MDGARKLLRNVSRTVSDRFVPDAKHELDQEKEDAMLWNYIKMIRMMKTQYLQKEFKRSASGKEKDDDSLTEQEDIIDFLEEFVKLHFFLQAIAAVNHDVAVTSQFLIAEIEKHVIKQLDAIITDGHAMINLNKGIKLNRKHEIDQDPTTEESRKNIDRLMDVISIASDYNITEFLAHRSIQAILKAHGMVTISKRPLDIIFSIFIYVFYPIIYANKRWRKKYLANAIISQVLPIYGILCIIPIMIYYCYLTVDQRFDAESVLKQLEINPEYEKNLETQKTLLIWTIFVWWLAFITKEMLEFYNNSSAFNHNDPFASFKPRHYYELISENDTKTAHCEETNHEIYEVMSSMQDRMKSPKIPGQSFSHRVSVRAPVQDTKYSKDRPRNWVTRSLSEVIVSKTNVFSDVVTNSLLKKKTSRLDEIVEQITVKGHKTDDFENGVSSDGYKQPSTDLYYKEKKIPENQPGPLQRHKTYATKENFKNENFSIHKLVNIDDIPDNKTQYFENFWNQNDWVIMICCFFFLLIHFSKLFLDCAAPENTCDSMFLSDDYLEKLFFSIALLCLIFRGLEHLGQFATFTGPFIRAFEKIFKVIIIFIFLIIIISLGCAFSLSNFLCKKPTPDQYVYLNNSFCGPECHRQTLLQPSSIDKTKPAEPAFTGSEFYSKFVNDEYKFGLVTKKLDHFKFCETVIPEMEKITDDVDLYDYYKCSSRIFKHFLVQPFGCTIGKACDYPYFVDQRFDIIYLFCYGERVNIMIRFVHMFFFTTIIVALMRGVLIKYLMGSQKEEASSLLIHRTTIYVQGFVQSTGIIVKRCGQLKFQTEIY